MGCVCQCGGRTTILLSNFGKTKSCGCVARESWATTITTHGMSGSASHKAWKSMMGRCYSPKNTSYARYGGRGITVCDRWRTFEKFYEDMGTPPSGLTLDREDNAAGYSPDNCRWATKKTQGRNKRNNVRDMVWGSLAEAVEHYGVVSYATAWARNRKGVPIDAAASLPLRSRLPFADGSTMNLVKEAKKAFGKRTGLKL